MNIEILYPAQVNLPNDNQIISTFYNNSNFINDSINSAFIFDNEIYYDSENTDSIASIIYYESMFNSLKNENFFDTIIDIGRRFPDIGKDSIYYIQKQDIDSLRKLNNCGTIYSLSYFQQNEISYKANTYAPNIDVAVYIKALWEVYDIQSDSSNLLMHNDTIFFNGPANKLGKYEVFAIERGNMIKDATTELGINFARMLVPHWEEVERLMYKSGNPHFIKAWEYAENNEWLKAAEIWNKLSTNKNKNIAAKSMFNLAIACEMSNDFDAAIDWSIKSSYVYGQQNPEHTIRCMKYINILTMRKMDIKTLDKQLSVQERIE